MAIVDQYGNPIERKVLDEPQTSSLAQLRQEFANHPSRGLTPAKIAAILVDGEQGDIVGQCELGLDMEEKDAHIFAEMSKRRRALLTLPWSIEPPRNPTPEEERRTEQMGELIQDVPELEDVIVDMADAIGHAFSNLEITWNDDPRYRIPEAIEHRPPTWFKLASDDRNELRLRDGTAEGAELWPFGWIRHTHRAKPGYLARGGLHRVLVWPFIFKNYSVRDLAELLEIYGLPVRVGTYPPSASDTEKSTLLKAVVGIGHNAAGIIPEGMALDFKDAATGRSDPFMVMMTWCERSESKAILGQTLSADAASTGLGSGVANLQGEVRRDLTVSDARQIAGTLTRDLVYPVAALNGLAPDGLQRAPRFVFETEKSEDLDARADRDRKIFEMGFKPTQDYIDRTYGEGFEPAPPPSLPPAAASLAALRAIAPQESEATLEAMAGRLEAESNDAMTAVIDQVRQAVNRAGSLQELQAELLRLYPDLSPDRLAGVMRLGFAAAELSGRYEAAQEDPAAGS